VDDARRGFASEVERIPATDQDVSGVEAQPDLGDLQQALDVGGSLDHGSVGGMEGDPQTTIARNKASSSGESSGIISSAQSAAQIVRLSLTMSYDET
jgi:hypothetical protein